jgi:hypothetical protein
MNDSSTIPFENRCKLLFYAWCIAALATVLIEIPLLLYFVFFPLGLLHILIGDKIGGSLYDFPYVCVCLLYFGMSAGVLAVKRRPVFFAIYGFLCVVLALNVVGCHQMLRAPLRA